MKFIHAADIHLDSPLRGLARYEGAPLEQIQNATREAFINLVDLACDEAVDFVLLAGDLYDVDWKDYNTGLFFNQQMNRLRDAQISVFVVLGNHDAGNSITKELHLPDNVKRFCTEQPETYLLEDLGVAIHGQSFPQKMVTDNLCVHYPKAIPGYFNIGLLHTALEGYKEHATYAPCTLADLLAQGYDYWALGHVHGREVVCEAPWVVFPGNLQGRHVRETGAKGCTLVHVGADHQITLTHKPVDVLRWMTCRLSLQTVNQIDDVFEKVRDAVTQAVQNVDNRLLALRFILEGACPIHVQLHSDWERWINEIRSVAADAGRGQVWIEKVQLKTHTIHQLGLGKENPLGELVDTLRTLPQDNSILQTLSAEFRSLKHALPVEARHKSSGIDPDDPNAIAHLLNGVEELLLSRLLLQE